MGPLAFFSYFLSNSGAHTELQTELFIQSMAEDCFNSINYIRVQEFSF